MSNPPADLVDLTEQFGGLIFQILEGCFDDVPAVEVEHYAERSVVKLAPPENNPDGTGGIPLKSGGETLAWLRLDVWCCLDSAEEWLAIWRSTYTVVSKLDRAPLLRFDYRRDMHTSPCSHIQVHAHRGAWSALLARTGRANPHDLSSLHLPTGGARFRPGLEDVLQFLIQDCQFDGRDTWRTTVEEARADYRRLQLRSAVRAMPSDAVRALRRLGYTVTPPPQGEPGDNTNALTEW